jgi:type I restriction enzyme S subunit
MSKPYAPTKWKQVKLAEYARVVSGATPRTSDPSLWGGDIHWVTPKDVSDLSGYRYLDSTPRTLTAEGLASCSAEILPPKSVLLSSRAPIGLLAINRIAVATNQGFKSFVPDAAHLDAGFLYHWLSANRAFLESLGTGATFKEISKAVVSRIELPLPPLYEQRQIAAVLDKAETLRRQRQESFQLTEELIRSVFLDMFGDPIENPKGWEVISFAEEMEKISYGTSVKCSAVSEKGSRAILRIPNVASGKIRWSNLKYASLSPSEWSSLKLIPGDILFVRTNGNPSMVARSAVFGGDHEAAFASYLIRVRLKKDSRLKSEFVNFVLSMPSWRVQLLKLARTTAGNYNINTQAIKGLAIIAPDEETQNRFCQAAIEQRRLAKILDKALLEVGLLFSSIQQRAFRGELNLSRIALVDEVEEPVPFFVAESPTTEGRFRRPGSLIAPTEIETQLLALEDRIASGPGDSIPWSEDFFKYRILSQVLTPPFGFNEIWEAVSYDMGDANYDDVKAKVFEYIEAGILEQRFDMERKEIVFYPRP